MTQFDHQLSQQDGASPAAEVLLSTHAPQAKTGQLTSPAPRPYQVLPHVAIGDVTGLIESISIIFWDSQMRYNVHNYITDKEKHMAGEGTKTENIKAKLDNGMIIHIQATPLGGTEKAASHGLPSFKEVTDSIEGIADAMVTSLQKGQAKIRQR